ncbi:17678_t:CDS:2 [Cetraspora pellucida]|uniref:17678_t:CDS:1 n=1 Tax=Cetraspora pellucida TaxID=1433469 RepID=A0ACA9NTH6_9GLOM|nr:17678_t:CDS:2 [Cetraspora pellucida]
MGYEEFKNELRIYILNLAENLEQGIYELPDEMKTVFVLLGKPGTGKSFISEMLSFATGWYLVNIDLGGRKDTEILEGTTPAVKGAFAGRLCQGFATGKQRMPIILLDEFEKVAGEGFEVDISNAIFLATANYADQVPDFVQDRAKFINIPLYTYEQRLKYVMGMLKRKLGKDELTKKYADQITEDFSKKGKGHAIENITAYDNLETTPTRFNLKYPNDNRIDLVRVRSGDAEYENDGKTVKSYKWLGDTEEAK